MSTPRKPGGRPGPASSLLADTRPAPKVIDVYTEPAAETSKPMATATLDEHQEAQREYREWMAKMSSQTPAQAAKEGSEGSEGSPEPEIAVLPTPEERKAREHEESVGSYLHALAEMGPDEPIYVVGVRPPRPQFAGLVLEVGDVVPGAAFWPRLDSWVRAGVVVPKQLTKAS